jgi:hypothetical protein
MAPYTPDCCKDLIFSNVYIRVILFLETAMQRVNLQLLNVSLVVNIFFFRYPVNIIFSHVASHYQPLELLRDCGHIS